MISCDRLGLQVARRPPRRPVLVSLRALQSPAPGRRPDNPGTDRRDQAAGRPQLPAPGVGKEHRGAGERAQGWQDRLPDRRRGRTRTGQLAGCAAHLLRPGRQVPDNNALVRHALGEGRQLPGESPSFKASKIKLKFCVVLSRSHSGVLLILLCSIVDKFCSCATNGFMVCFGGLDNNNM